MCDVEHLSYKFTCTRISQISPSTHAGWDTIVTMIIIIWIGVFAQLEVDSLWFQRITDIIGALWVSSLQKTCWALEKLLCCSCIIKKKKKEFSFYTRTVCFQLWSFFLHEHHSVYQMMKLMSNNNRVTENKSYKWFWLHNKRKWKLKYSCPLFLMLWFWLWKINVNKV